MPQINAIAEAMFLVTITVASLAPRPDREDTSWLGTAPAFSGPFRRALFCVTCTLTFRCLFLKDHRFTSSSSCEQDGNDVDTDCIHIDESGNGSFILHSVWLYYVWVGMESIFLAFLKLCMPYLLQVHLSMVINIQPGENLKAWLYMVIAMDALSLVLTASYSPRFWAIKRLGDALAAIPVIQTVRQYRRILGVREQAWTLTDTLLAQEVCRFSLVVGAAIGYAVEGNGGRSQLSNDNWHSRDFWIALRLASTYSGYVSVLLHGMLLNLLDEVHYRASASMAEAAAAADGNQGARQDFVSDDDVMMLVPRSAKGMK